MTLPTSWQTVRVFGTYKRFDTGEAAHGAVTFEPVLVTAPEGSGRTVVLPKPRTVTLDVAGKIDIQLPATDDPDIAPTGWAYRVTEKIGRSEARAYFIHVPLAGGDIDLAAAPQVVPIDPMAAYLTSADIGVNVASQAAATSLDARVDALEASPGGGAWGTITGTLSAQTDLQAALDGKATAAQGAKADSAIQPGDAALTDAREWTAATVTQAEAEVGTDTARKAWSVLRVWQAIAAWWAASAAKTKLDGIAAGATVGADWSTNVTNKPTLGNSAALDVGTTAGTVAAGDDSRLSDARTPTAHTHTAAQISDSTAVGRSVVTATDAAAACSAIGALATTGGTMTGAITGNVGGVTDFTQLKVDGSTFSEPVQDFMFAGRLFSGVNLPGGSSLPNCVYNIGWGIGENGAPLVAGQPALRIAFEQNFINPGNPAAYEWHLSFYDTTGYEHRPISSYLHKDGSRGSQVGFSTDWLGINDDHYVQKIKYDLQTNIIDHFGGMTYRFGVNNYPAFQQMNAAGNGYVNLPYVNGNDRLYCAQSGAVFVGNTPTTGNYANAFMQINALTTPDYGSVLSIEANNPAGSVYATNAVINAGNDLMFSMQNVNSGANANTVLYLRTQGTTAGDPFVRYTVNGGEDWAVGVDNSDDDAFVCSQWVPGSDNRLRLSRAGNLSVKSTIATGKFVVASLPTGSEGMTAYATNGRKQGEGSGAGTGVPVYFSAAKWRRYSDDTEVVA